MGREEAAFFRASPRCDEAGASRPDPCRGHVAKPNFIDLPGVAPIPIRYEDRSVVAIDKPRGWLLVPHS